MVVGEAKHAGTETFFTPTYYLFQLIGIAGQLLCYQAFGVLDPDSSTVDNLRVLPTLSTERCATAGTW
jgi:hypothetical protein